MREYKQQEKTTEGVRFCMSLLLTLFLWMNLIEDKMFYGYCCMFILLKRFFVGVKEMLLQKLKRFIQNDWSSDFSATIV